MVDRHRIIPCRLPAGRQQDISNLADAIQSAAPSLGAHGMSVDDFRESRILEAAIERLRGKRVAAMAEKRRFMQEVLDHLQTESRICSWQFVGGGERYDYEIRMPTGRVSIVETKGCLDGNNTNIFQRPAQADEFVIWSLCQNPGGDPQHNAWSGLHTRLGAEIVHRREPVDAVIIWDMLCGTAARPCPKLEARPQSAVEIAGRYRMPPPCVYMMPASVPDPRNNPHPRCARPEDVRLAQALLESFGGGPSDIVEVRIEVRIADATIERKTTFVRDQREIASSRWTKIKRARI